MYCHDLLEEDFLTNMRWKERIQKNEWQFGNLRFVLHGVPLRVHSCFYCAPSTFHPIIPRSPNIWVLCCVGWIRKDNKYTNLNKIAMSGQQRIFFFFNVRTVVKAWECFHKCPLNRMWMDLLAQEAQGLKEHLRVRSEFCVNKEPTWMCHIQKAQAFPVCPGGETIEVHIFLISWSWVELVTET